VVERWGARRRGRRYLSPGSAAAFSHVMLLWFRTHHTERPLNHLRPLKKLNGKKTEANDGKNSADNLASPRMRRVDLAGAVIEHQPDGNENETESAKHFSPNSIPRLLKVRCKHPVSVIAHHGLVVIISHSISAEIRPKSGSFLQLYSVSLDQSLH
jgi:hypothetical protein